MFLNLLQHWQRTRANQGGEQTGSVPTPPQPVIENDAKKEVPPEEPPADRDE